MAASTGAREAFRKPGEMVSYQMGAVKINKGTMVHLHADGFAYPATSGVAADVFAGVAYETADNSAGAAGALSIRIEKAGSYVFGMTAPVQANVGQEVYALDDQTVTLSATSNVAAGYIMDIEGVNLVRVRIDRAVQ